MKSPSDLANRMLYTTSISFIIVNDKNEFLLLKTEDGGVRFPYFYKKEKTIEVEEALKNVSEKIGYELELQNKQYYFSGVNSSSLGDGLTSVFFCAKLVGDSYKKDNIEWLQQKDFIKFRFPGSTINVLQYFNLLEQPKVGDLVVHVRQLQETFFFDEIFELEESFLNREDQNVIFLVCSESLVTDKCCICVPANIEYKAELVFHKNLLYKFEL